MPSLPLPVAPDAAVVADDRRSTDERAAFAIDLGWRIAELYALNVEYEPVERLCDLLPGRSSLSRDDRLELELLAAAGAAGRLGVDVSEVRVNELRELAGRAAARTGDAQKEFREALERCHVALDKALWTHGEAEGRAYELGIMLSDTYNRLLRVYHERSAAAAQEWRDVFGEPRITTLLTLLDNLQSRLDPSAVTVVRDHLSDWRERVSESLPEGEDVGPPDATATEHVRSQAVAWRQLLTGDKEPEAFLDPQARRRVKDQLLHLMWRRYWVYALALFAALAVTSGVLVRLHPDIGSWYDHHTRDAALVTSLFVSVAGALGISKASINRAVRQDLRKWSALLWNRALAHVVYLETSHVESVFPQPRSRWKRALNKADRLRLHLAVVLQRPVVPAGHDQ
ncbi:MAG TPA: hypothetical protein VF066_17105 [Thermoleophilaceae bacterium]